MHRDFTPIAQVWINSSTSKIHAAKILCALFIMVVGKQRKCEGEDEDLYTPLEVNDESNSNFKSEKTLDLTNRPPAPTPRPDCMQLKEGRTPYIAQGNTFCCLTYLLIDAFRDTFVKECLMQEGRKCLESAPPLSLECCQTRWRAFCTTWFVLIP